MVARVTWPQPRELALVATVSEAFELRFKTSGWLAASSPTSTHPPWHLWSDSPDIKPPNPSTRTTMRPASPPQVGKRWCRAEALELQNRLEFLLKPRSLSTVPELDSVGLGKGREFAFLKTQWSRDHALRTRKKQHQRNSHSDRDRFRDRDRGWWYVF